MRFLLSTILVFTYSFNFSQYPTEESICDEELNTQLIYKRCSYRETGSNPEHVIIADHYDSIGRIFFQKYFDDYEVLKYKTYYDYSVPNQTKIETNYFNQDTSREMYTTKIDVILKFDSLNNMTLAETLKYFNNGKVYKTTEIYNYLKGNLSSVHYLEFDSSGRTNTFRIDSNLYDINGKLTQYLYIDNNQSIWETRNYDYNSENQVSRIEYIIRSQEPTFDSLHYENGCLVKWVNYVDNLIEFNRTEYIYNSTSGLIEKYQGFIEGNLVFEKTYEYDEQGNLVKKCSIDIEYDETDCINYFIEYKK